jgi:hypothetical protein
MKRIGETHDTERLRIKLAIGFFVRNGYKSGVAGHGDKIIRRPGRITHFSDYGRPVDVRNVDERNSFARFPFRIEIAVVVMLRGQKPHDLIATNRNVSNYLDLILSKRLPMLVFRA